MINTENVQMTALAVHKIGNKAQEEGIRYSNALLETDDYITELLLKYFLSPFKSQELFNLYHESDLSLNEVYSYANQIFEDPSTLFEHSVNLAKHLYAESVHPNIKPGEFYTVYLKDLELNGETADAIGLFKSESKDNYLKVYPKDDNFAIDHDKGININKLDKGCLIFDIEPEEGYLVMVVDNLSKGNEALYWKDNFLKVYQRSDEYFFTESAINLCKQFVTEQMPKEYQMDKADQSDLLNRSAKFFKEKEVFDSNEFVNEVVQQPEALESFSNFKQQYENEWQCSIDDGFAISDTAVKKKNKVFKSIIKLDKNFHIYIHGNRERIVRGHDEASGMNYYQLFFEEEE